LKYEEWQAKKIPNDIGIISHHHPSRRIPLIGVCNKVSGFARQQLRDSSSSRKRDTYPA
jgi:hypothetical protein